MTYQVQWNQAQFLPAVIGYSQLHPDSCKAEGTFLWDFEPVTIERTKGLQKLLHFLVPINIALDSLIKPD